MTEGSLSKTHQQEMARYIDSWVDYRSKNLDVPGFAVGISYNGKTILKKAYGYANVEEEIPLTTDHTFRIASHSKTFTATALMQLVERKKLLLDEPVSKFVKGFKSKKDKRVEQLTVRQLLCHTAGISRDGSDSTYWELQDDFPSRRKFLEFVKDTRLFFHENACFKYSNFGFAALGLVIEKISGLSYSEYIQKNILAPLKIKAMGVDLDAYAEETLACGYSRDFMKLGRRIEKHVPTNALASATGFYSDLDSLLRYGIAHFYGNERIITDRSKREINRQRFETGRRDGNYYGLGMDIEEIGDRKVVGHGGGFPGFITKTFIDPEKKLVVTVLTNATDGPAVAMAKGIVHAVNFFEEHADTKSKIPRKELKRLTGRYYCTWNATDIVLVGNTLVAVATDSWDAFDKPNRLSYHGKNSLRLDECSGFESIGETLRYQFDKSGKPTKLVWGGFPLYPWERFKKIYL